MKISEAEYEVLKILWDKGNVTSFDIIDELKGNKSWGQSTIRTLITRLLKKGAIEVVEQNGRTYTYRAIVKEDEYTKKESSNLLAKLYKGSINNMLLNFVQEKKLTKKDLQDLINLIEDKENK